MKRDIFDPDSRAPEHGAVDLIGICLVGAAVAVALTLIAIAGG